MPMQNVRSIASKAVYHVAPDTLVAEALKLMSSKRISCLVVVLQDTAVGILTERDFVHAANKVLDFPNLQVREVMSSPILTVGARKPVTEVYRLLKENRIRNLVVLDENYDIEGVVTLTDIIHKLHAEYFDRIRDVAEIMSRKVKTVNPEQSARYALSLMTVHSISCIVVAEKDRPLGIFTERDAARLIAEQPQTLADPIEASMSHPVETIPASTSPRRAAALMKAKGVRRLLVLDNRGRIEGLVTQSDISRVLESFHEQTLAGPATSGPESIIRDYHVLPFSRSN